MRLLPTEELLKMTACELCEYLGIETLNDCIGYPLDIGVMRETEYNEYKEND